VGSWITPRPHMAPMVERLPLVAGWDGDLCPYCVALDAEAMRGRAAMDGRQTARGLWNVHLAREMGDLHRTLTWREIAVLMSRRLGRPIPAYSCSNAWSYWVDRRAA
jgi:hypothetical protein